MRLLAALALILALAGCACTTKAPGMPFCIGVVSL